MTRQSHLAATALATLALALAGCTGAARVNGALPEASANPAAPPAALAAGSTFDSDHSAGPVAGPKPAAPATGMAEVLTTPATARDQAMAVDLDHSFQIPKGEDADLSHTPALVFTSDGERMVVATADQELIVFHAGSRQLISRHRLADKASDGVSIDPQGRIAVWVLEGGGIAVVDVASGEITARDDQAGATWVAVDPACRLVAVSHGATVEIRRLVDLEVLQRVTGSAGDITNLAWSRDGGRLATTSGGGRLQVLDASSGTSLFVIDKPAPLYAADFHPAGTRIAFGGQDRTVYQVELASGAETVLSGDQPYWITCLGYSPDGTLIAVGDESCDVWLYDLDQREPVFHSKHHVECWLNSVAWATDNQTFLFGCRPNSLAGKPNLYDPLNQVEAARSAKVRASRQALSESIDSELEKEQTPQVAAALEQIKRSLADEEKLEAYGPGVAQQQLVSVSNAQLQQQTVEPQGGMTSQLQNKIQNAQALGGRGQAGLAPVDTSLLPEETRKRLEAHQQAHHEAQEELKQSFVVNQWKVKR